MVISLVAVFLIEVCCIIIVVLVLVTIIGLCLAVVLFEPAIVLRISKVVIEICKEILFVELKKINRQAGKKTTLVWCVMYADPIE